MTWKELKDKISLMTEEEQQQEVAVWGENMNLMKDCSLEKTDEDLYYNTEWDYTCEESELEPEDKNDPDVHKVYEAGMHYIYSKGETGYSKEEFDKIDEKNKNPELTSINTFNDTVKKANEIKDRVLKYVYNIKQERSYNNDLVGIFERYKDIADGDMEVAMNFIKEAYPFNEETESFIRKKFDMPIPDESKEQ